MEPLSIIRKVTGIIGNSPLIDLIRPREGHVDRPEGPPPTLLEFAHQHSLCLEIRKDGIGRYHVGFSDSPIFYRIQKSGQDPVSAPRRLYPRSSSNPLTAARKLCDKIRGKKLILNYEYGVPVTDQYVKKTVQVHKDIYVDEDEFAAYLQDLSGVL